MAKKQKEEKPTVFDKINKIYGDGSILKAKGEGPVKGIERIPFGIPSIDYILGGGLPKGRIIEVYGPEASSKTTLCLHAIAAAQKETGKEVAFIDAEHSLNLEYAENLGINLERLYLSQPDYGEQALEILDFLLDSELSMIVVDSVAALTPKSEIEGEMGDSKMGLHARLMSQAMRKIVARVEKSGITVLFVNQIRMKIGVMFGSPEVTPGGQALKFYSSIRLDVRSSTKIKKGEEIIGNLVKIKAAKNKTAPPFRIAEINLYYGTGYSLEADVLGICIESGIIKKSGSWYSYGETKLGQGELGVIDILENNPELVEQLKNDIENVEIEVS